MKTKTTMVILIVTAIMLVGVTVIHKTTNLLTCTGIPYSDSMFLSSEDGGYIIAKRVMYHENGDTLHMGVWFYPLSSNTVFPSRMDYPTIICMDMDGNGEFEHMHFTFEEGTSGLMFVGDNQDDPSSWVCAFENKNSIPERQISDSEKKHFVEMLSEIKQAKEGSFLCY